VHTDDLMKPVSADAVSDIIELAWAKFRTTGASVEDVVALLFMREPDAGPMTWAEATQAREALIFAAGSPQPTAKTIPDLSDWLLLTRARRRGVRPPSGIGSSQGDPVDALLWTEIGRRNLEDRYLAGIAD